MKRLSGKFVVRMSEELHRSLRERARSEGVSLNELCIRRLREKTQRESSSSQISPEITESLISFFKDKLIGILLFGSAARGEQTSASDIDLLLVLSPSTPLNRNLYSEWDRFAATLSSKFGKKISPQFTHLPKNYDTAGSIWYEAAIDGIILWEKERAHISSFITKVRKAMAEGKITRKESHGHPYWIKHSEELPS